MRNLFRSPIRALFLAALIAALTPMTARAASNGVDAALRALLTTSSRHEQVARPSDVAQVYSVRGFQPLWQTPAQRAELLAQIEALADDGLDPTMYALDRLRHPVSDSAPALQRARDDLALSAACTLALTHLRQGRLSPEASGGYWQSATMSAPSLPDPATELGRVGSDELAALFDRYRPHTPLYEALRSALRTARQAGSGSGLPHLPEGATLKPGMSGPRVAALRARLIASGHLPPPAGSAQTIAEMDDSLAAAVRQFQQEEGLESDGQVGRLTLAALNRSPAERRTLLRINLERARWLALQQHGDHVFVDVAGYQLTYIRNSEPVWSARTQVGQPSRQTPLLFSRITHFTVNPTWTVPPTILRKDIIPKVRADLAYLDEHNIRIIDGGGTEIDPATVDWTHTAGLTFRQDAGDGAALGKVVLRFSNPHAVYLHDTPNQRQFKRSQRAFSSGCVRVENAVDLARLLVDTSGGNALLARFESALESGHTGNINLPRSIPVIIAYLTAAPDQSGRITYRNDVYDQDSRLIQALENNRN